MSHPSSSVCPKYHRAVELIGRRWTGAIVNVLLHGRRRFNEIAAVIPDISDRMLVERLRELESEHILARIVVPETPVRVEYELTDKGRALESAVRAIESWAEHWVTADEVASAPTSEVPADERAGSRPEKDRQTNTRKRSSRSARRA
jgi:DNA-binding HxlR family transcriptional regulator